LYSLADGLGSTMAVVDSSGTSQKSYTYDLYGEATPSGALANEFDFAGQQTPRRCGGHYFHERGATSSDHGLTHDVGLSGAPAYRHRGRSSGTTLAVRNPGGDRNSALLERCR
jgi:hypothetical protein